MIPILLVSQDQKKIKTFIKGVKKEYNISENCVYSIKPENKEISINQIKEIKNNLIYAIKEPCLYIVSNFDKSSYEAQNAFLKTLEEHNDLVHFILIASQYQHLAPTILSRSKIIIYDDRVYKISEETEHELKNFIKDKDLKILNSKTFQVKFRKNPIEIFDEMIVFFKKTLTDYKYANGILKEILLYRYYVINNNVNPQSAVDHILIFIYSSGR